MKKTILIVMLGMMFISVAVAGIISIGQPSEHDFEESYIMEKGSIKSDCDEGICFAWVEVTTKEEDCYEERTLSERYELGVLDTYYEVEYICDGYKEVTKLVTVKMRERDMNNSDYTDRLKEIHVEKERDTLKQVQKVVVAK